MVSIQLPDLVMKKLQARAAEAGTTVSELIARLVDDDDVGTYELTTEQQAQVLVGIEEADRGDVVSADEVMAALRAARG
jgi:predicted transcriptional regulator